MSAPISILVRGKPHSVPAETPVDLHLPEYNIIISRTTFEAGVILWSNVNIYGAHLGAESKIGAFVEIRSGVRIGRRVKIEPFVFIPEGVTIEDDVFIGPNVVFTNDLYPRATGLDGRPANDYHIVPTTVRRGASIGAASAIRCGITIGEEALVGMGSIVVREVPAKAVVYGPRAETRRTLT